MLNQGYPNLEYFIVDGGSTDGSVEIIKEYGPSLDWWVSEPDEGQSDAINKGFDKATGEILCWVNSDDVLFPGCLHEVAKSYISNGKPEIIHANVAYIDSESRIIRFVRVPRQRRFLFFRGVWHGVAPCVFFSAELFKALGSLKTRYHLSMDLDIWMRMMKAGARVAHVARYLGGFRQHYSSKTSSFLRSRTTRENTETAEIFNSNLPQSNKYKRYFWRKVCNVYQVLNLNYIRAYINLKALGKTRHWKKCGKHLFL